MSDGIERRGWIPRIARLYRMQWEEAQNAFVLLFPEGMVQLNPTAGEILRRCNGTDSAGAIIAGLERDFQSDAIASDVDAFFDLATKNGWVEWHKGAAS